LDTPDEELAKAENILTISPAPQFGQIIPESSDADLRSSNFDPHLLHLYSKIGIGQPYFNIISFSQYK